MKIIDRCESINKLLNDASIVFIVSHRDIDLDALGSCLAMCQYADNLGKTVYLILDDKKKEKSVARVLDELDENFRFITSTKMKEIKNKDSLLMVLDTNKNYLLQTPNIDSYFDKKIVIDHHDMGNGTIEDGEIIIDGDASSTCEMITAFLKLNKFPIDSNLATVLLSGIILDTNNYTLKTDSDTFFYSHYLTTCGANPSKVQYLLKQDLKKYIKRQKMITNVKVINNIAITKGVVKEVYRREELAKTADSLLLFDGIEASFVIAHIDRGTIGISARSMGKINVGQVLSMFGGGGDINFAAAKIDGDTISKIEQELLRIIKLL